MKKTNKITMTVAEIIEAINNDAMTVDEIIECVNHEQMDGAEIRNEAADWWAGDWTADDIAEIAERYEDEYGIILSLAEKSMLREALEKLAA